MKKAESLSMNTIIIAAIALLVLVIVSIIFMSRMGWFVKASNDCSKVKGSCDGRNCPPGWEESPTHVCYDGDVIDRFNVCCVRLSG